MSKLSVFLQLLKRDFTVFRRDFFGNLFDSTFVLVTILVVFGYIMSPYGLGGDYGSFMLISSVASFGFFGTVGKVFRLTMDIEGDKTISYTLTLPLPSWMVFTSIAIFWSIDCSIMSFFLFPVGKLILFNSFDLSKISYAQLIPMYLSMNIFFGFFSLWISSILRKMNEVERLWIRVINPLVMFGCWYYSWAAVYSISASLAIIELANPMTYVMEGMREAALGIGTIPYWICLSVIWIFIIACAWDSIRRLQNRLDCVR